MSAQKDKTIAQIVACQKKATDAIHAEMDRLNDRIQEIDRTIDNGGILSDDERAEKAGLLEAIDTLADIETRVILFSIGALDRTNEVKALAAGVEEANKELADAKKKVEDLSASLKQVGDFLKAVTGVLTTMVGLLKALVL